MQQEGMHRRARINYCIRTGAFAYSFLVIGLHGWQLGFGGLFWALLAAQFLVYPHLAYLRARRAADPKRVEETNLYIDSGLLGIWIAALHFPTWIVYAALFSTSLNATVIRGAVGAMWSIGCFGAGAALGVAALGFGFAPATSAAVTLLCFAGALAYSGAVGWVVYRQNLRLAAGREALRASEERYRLIAENAGDLIGMVDHAGRWLYTSPSYQRILEPADLETGTDALRRLHPGDAERLRVALLRASVTGKARELALRLVDRYGRFHQYKTRLQVLGGGASPRLLLVSQDVTDLKESEEKLLVAGHALEGMTEAILICAADGTIVTVNRAFTEITGHAKDEVLGQPESRFRNALQPPTFYQEVYAIIERDGYWSGTTWAKRKSGAVYREWRSIRPIRDAGGALTHYLMVFSEVDAPGARSQSLPQDLSG
jgi:PAS domain S-box-containing protein